jgi:AcrR family transcriptional regulator
VTLVDRAVPHRTRLLLAMATVLADKGYATLTIADVVAEAGVSKRTFYEHFASKEDCLLACYAEASARLMEITRTAVEGVRPGPERVEVAVDAYYAALDEGGRLTIAMLTEIQAAGAGGRAARRKGVHDYARLIRELVHEGAAEAGMDLALGVEESIALCGGLYELALGHAESLPDEPFATLAPAAKRFVLAVLGSASFTQRG